MFIVSRPIRCEMKPQKITDKPQNGLITTWFETASWLFLPRGIFNFTVFKYWIFSFSISALLSPKNRYERLFTEKRSYKRRQDQTARQRIWEQEKMSQSQTMLLGVCFTYSSKGHASQLWLVVFDPYFFVAEKPSLMTPTCTVVNFHNWHSLLGLFGRVVFEQTESSDWCWFVVKK